MAAPPTEMALDAHGQEVQGMFDRIAHGYDRANRWMSWGTDGRWRKRAVRTLMPQDARAQPRVLDLCAGTMDSSLEIHRQYPQADIVAGDFAAQMLDKGRHKLVGEAGQRITPTQMDAHDLPFSDNTYDAVFCAFGTRNLSDVARACREQARILRPGGVLTVLEFFRPASLIAKLFHAVYNRTALPLIGWAATGDLAAYRYLPRSMANFMTVEQYRDVLRDAGFADVTTRPLTFGIAWMVRATVPRELET